MRNDRHKVQGTPQLDAKPQPHRVRLPGFVTDQEIGLGDALSRLTYRAGMQPCGGCGRRQAALNRWVVFTR